MTDSIIAPSMTIALDVLADEAGIPARSRSAIIGRHKYLIKRGLLDRGQPGRGHKKEVSHNDFRRLWWGLSLSLVGLTPDVITNVLGRFTDAELGRDELTFSLSSPFGGKAAQIVARLHREGGR